MNKQELIDRAVLAHKGIFPYGKRQIIIVSTPRNDCWGEGKYDKFSGTAEELYILLEGEPLWVPVCDYNEFLQRAKELGFVEQTGYRWGVEYETNGEKPELPDVKVKVCIDKNDWSYASSVHGFNWDNTKYFRIVDERYKPVEAVPSAPITNFDDYDGEFEAPEPDRFDVADVLLEQIAVLNKLGENDLADVLQEVNAKLIAKVEAEALRERVVDAVYEYGLSQGYDQCKKELEGYYDKGFLKLPEGYDNV